MDACKPLVSGQPLEWRVSFDPTTQVMTDLRPATLWQGPRTMHGV